MIPWCGMYCPLVSCLRSCIWSYSWRWTCITHLLQIPYVPSYVLVYMSSQDCLYICTNIHIYCMFTTNTHVSVHQQYTYSIMSVHIYIYSYHTAFYRVSYMVCRASHINQMCNNDIDLWYASVSYLRCLDSLRLNLVVDTSMNTIQFTNHHLAYICDIDTSSSILWLQSVYAFMWHITSDI